MAKSFSVSPEVNLIGMTTDEAMPVLDKYLDDAYLAHLPQVRVCMDAEQVRCGLRFISI